MREPKLVYDYNSVTPVILGSLDRGGIISNTPTKIEIFFGCVVLKYSVTDFELTLEFENNDIVELFFKKECENVGPAQEYFNFFYTIYYILLILILLLFIGAVYFYLKKNDISLDALYQKVINQFRRWWGSRGSKPSEEEYSLNPTTNLYEESDLVDFKIKTETKPISKNDVKYNKFSTDYGGI
jgi:hypothetical protein